MNNRSLTLCLDDDLWRELNALRRQLQLRRFEGLRNQALPFGEAAGWRTDDDVFRATS